MTIRTALSLAAALALAGCSNLPSTLNLDGGCGSGDGGVNACHQHAPGDGGSDGGTDGGNVSCDAAFAGCNSYTDMTNTATVNVTISGSFDYTPRCLKVSAGTNVIIENTHPFVNKCAPSGATFNAGGVVLSTVGYYNYYCSTHGPAGDGSGMAGSIQVVP